MIEANSPSLSSQVVSQEQSNWMKPLIITLSISVIVVLAVMTWLLFFGGSKNPTVQQVEKLIPNITNASPTPKPGVSIAGTITFEGYAPENSYLVIVERTGTDREFRSVVTGLLPESGIIPWTWDDATKGSNYEMRTQLKIRGKTIQESASIFVSAPAEDVTLSLISEQNPPKLVSAAISGTIHLDGYIPSGSTLSILTRQVGKEVYTPVITNLAATSNVKWTWADAVSGQTYDILVQLKNAAGTVISTDPNKTITAPSSGVMFDISSTFQPPSQTVTGISGVININGNITTNSYVTIAQRKTGTATFSQIGTIAAKDDSSWSWNGANSGTQYDIQAYLWVDGKPFAQSNILTVTAPSSNNLMTINAQLSLAAPAANTVNVTCNASQNGSFQATISYNTNGAIQNAQQYKIVVTNASNGSQVVNTTLTPSNPNQTQSLTTGYQFTSGTTFYAQYAYSNNNVFSPLSPSTQFSCR
jgi:hypothetical protein